MPTPMLGGIPLLAAWAIKWHSSEAGIRSREGKPIWNCTVLAVALLQRHRPLLFQTRTSAVSYVQVSRVARRRRRERFVGGTGNWVKAMLTASVNELAIQFSSGCQATCHGVADPFGQSLAVH